MATSIVIVILGLFVAANLYLTLAVVRRLRELEDGLRTSRDSDGLPASGTPVRPFEAVDQNGDRLTHLDLAQGDWRVAFLLTGCGPCKQTRAALKAQPLDDCPLVVVVAGSRENPETEEILGDLPSHARVILGPEIGGVMTTALGVSAYPAILKIKDGVVAFAATRLMAHPAPSAEVPA